MKLAELMVQVRQASNNVLDMMELNAKLEAMGISLENIYQELEMNSAFADSHRDISRGSERVLPHSHSFYEVILCCACEDVQYLLGSQRYRIQKGDVLLIPPGVSHCPLFPETMHRPYERIVVWINAELLQRIHQRPEMAYDRERWNSHYLLRTAGTRWENTIAEAFQRGCTESEKRYPGWEGVLYGNTTMLIALLNRMMHMNPEHPDSEQDGLLDALLHYVENHLTEKISVTTAARHLLVSESTVTHLCSRQLGVSFYQYVIRQRLVVAKQYMQENVPLGQIWELAGFSDYSTFYRAFRKEYGLPPREFRKLLQMDNTF